MRTYTILISILIVFTLITDTLAQQNGESLPVHLVENGDTFESIASQYDTCSEAIIWQNRLVRAGFYSSQFIVKAGTELRIPSRSACDDLPTGEYVHVVEHGDTITGLMTRYCSRLSLPWSNPLEIGDRVTISRVESAYELDHHEVISDHCGGSDYLIVYDDNDDIFYSNLRFYVEDIAACYGVSSSSIIVTNLGEFQHGNSSSMYSSRGYVIPDVTQECMIYERLTTSRSGDQIININQTLACYPQPLEQMADLPSYNLDTLHLREETGDFCYTLEEVLTILLDPLDLDWFKWSGSAPSHERDNWRQESISGREWENLARCIGVTIQDIRDVNGNMPYFSEIFPPLPASYPTYYIVPKPRRPCYLFEQEVLQMQRIHVVEENETLSSIAAQYNLLTVTLAQANSIQNWNRIYEGEWLLIPNHPNQSEIELLVALGSSIFLLMATIITLYHIKLRPKSQ